MVYHAGMGNVLGLDISTTYTGIALIDERMTERGLHDGSNIIDLDHIDFKGCDSFWDKARRVRDYFNDKRANVEQWKNIDRLFVEQSLQSFRPGLSSASTIVTLAKFNGLVSFFAMEAFGKEPVYVAANTARKACGIKLVRSASAGGKNHKEQTFSFMEANDLSGVKWPTKQRSDKLVDWSRDVTDAYVVAKGGLLSLPIL